MYEGQIAVTVRKDGLLGIICEETGGVILACAMVINVPTVDEWGDLFSEVLFREEENPIWNASLAAVKRWGGRVIVMNPASVGDA